MLYNNKKYKSNHIIYDNINNNYELIASCCIPK